MKINFRDGSAMVKLTVKAAADPNVPRTADESNPTLWMALMAASLAGTIGIASLGRRRRTHR